MRRIRAQFGALESVLPSGHWSYVCQACSRRLIAANPWAVQFSTSARRRDTDKEATSWEHLEWVGTQRWIDSFLKPRRPLQPFSPLPIDRDPDVLKDHLLKALVETVLASNSSQPATLAPPANIVWPRGIHITFDPESKKPTVKFSREDDEQSLKGQLFISTQELGNVEQPESRVATKGTPSERSRRWRRHRTNESSVDKAEGAATGASSSQGPPLIETEGSTWMRVPLDDPVTKFQVIKRIIQRTGIKLSDPLIQSCADLGTLYRHLLTSKPQPRKLAQQIQVDPRLSTLENVQIHRRRITDVTKDKVSGRWKVIQQELESRGLPEFNNAFRADQGRKFMRWKSVRYKRNFIWKQVQP